MLYSLRNRLSITFALLLIVSFVFMYIFISEQSRDIIGESLESSVSETMDQYTFSVNMIVTQIEDFANLMFNSDMTQAWLSAQADEHLSDDHKMLADLKMRQFLKQTTINYSVISSVSMFHRNGISIGIQDQIFRNVEFTEMSWYRKFKEQGKQWVTVHTDPYQPPSMAQTPIVSLVFPLGVYNPEKAESVLKVNFHSGLIQEPLEQISMGERGRVLLVDWEGNPILDQTEPIPIANFKEQLSSIRNSNASSGMLRIETNSDSQFLFYRTLKVHDWILIGIVSEHDLYKKLSNLNTTMVIIIAILLGSTVIAATILSASIVKPLSKLSSAMRQLKKGDFSRSEKMVTPKVNRKTEVGFVTESFLIMIQQLKQHIQSEFEMNIRRQGAEYKALLMQINPHFLYNTLEVVSSLTLQNRTFEAVKVIESLGQMLRFSLNIQSDLVTVKEEIQYIRYYVSILEVRFSNRLQINIDIEPQINNEDIVKFILQPIVENAVKYSLIDDQITIIQIKGWLEEDCIHFRVDDNGIGISDSISEKILNEFQSSQFSDVLNTQGKQIGLRNVLARCALYYGEAFSVQIGSESGKGTSIMMSLPKRGGSS